MRDLYKEAYGVSSWLFPIATLSLFLGGLGEAGLYGSFVRQLLWKSALGVAFELPALTIYVSTYLRVPILSPSLFRFCLLVLLSWYAFFAVLMEILGALGYFSFVGPNFGFRIIMHAGWISFVPLVFAYVTIRDHESRRAQPQS